MQLGNGKCMFSTGEQSVKNAQGGVPGILGSGHPVGHSEHGGRGAGVVGVLPRVKSTASLILHMTL